MDLSILMGIFHYTYHTLGGDECSQGASPWGARGAEWQAYFLASHDCTVHLYQDSFRLLRTLILHHTKASDRAALILSKLENRETKTPLNLN